jgi:hypothetical protein
MLGGLRTSAKNFHIVQSSPTPVVRHMHILKRASDYGVIAKAGGVPKPPSPPIPNPPPPFGHRVLRSGDADLKVLGTPSRSHSPSRFHRDGIRRGRDKTGRPQPYRAQTLLKPSGKARKIVDNKIEGARKCQSDGDQYVVTYPRLGRAINAL